MTTKVLCTNCDIYCSLVAADAKVAVCGDMPDNLVRMPHGWWRSEIAEGTGTESDTLTLSDAQLCPDDSDYLDAERGIPHMKGIPCSIDPVHNSRI